MTNHTRFLVRIFVLSILVLALLLSCGCSKKEEETPDVPAPVEEPMQEQEAAPVAEDGYVGYRDAEAVGELRLGQQVRVGAYNSAWAIVRAGNIAGFVRTEDIARLVGAPGYSVMIIEIILLNLFGFAWLVKGEAFPFLNDREETQGDKRLEIR